MSSTEAILILIFSVAAALIVIALVVRIAPPRSIE